MSYKKESSGVRTGERAGQLTLEPLPIHFSGNLLFKLSRTIRVNVLDNHRVGFFFIYWFIFISFYICFFYAIQNTLLKYVCVCVIEKKLSCAMSINFYLFFPSYTLNSTMCIKVNIIISIVDLFNFLFVLIMFSYLYLSIKD